MPRIDYSFQFPMDVCRFAFWQYPQIDVNQSIHTHVFHEVFWVEEGEGVHVINGERRRLFPGLLVLIRREDVHGFSAARKGQFVRFANFAFACELWERLRRRYFTGDSRGGGNGNGGGGANGNGGSGGGWFAEKDHRKREFELDAAQLERLRAMAHDLEAGARDALSAEAFLAGVMALLVNVQHSRQVLPEWLSIACKRIQKPEHFRGGTAELARLAGRSPEHVAREVQRLLKKTPTDILNEARMTYAAHELNTTAREIIDIAADCGLENLGHFYKIFRRRFGVTPHRYRKHAYAAPDLRLAGG
ncbi:helix-turn-helix transcriptional regulator [Geminisphaera colitermitum]|uniref:helix-turn-helix transcriptional regulator n=1 Tax=Geminisphaera colitermitum TaxID=1148786 RepID=UPI0005B9CB24|nr:AraC family transcriptional regulator [Geminisphaera colitermitum]